MTITKDNKTFSLSDIISISGDSWIAVSKDKYDQIGEEAIAALEEAESQEV